MPPRRSHVKTRTGCYHCKRKKIKCDETKPICKNCSRYRAVCTYKPTEVPISFTNGLDILEPINLGFNSRIESPGALVESGNNFSPDAGRTATRESSNSLSSLLLKDPEGTENTSDFYIRDIELMHHFKTYTIIGPIQIEFDMDNYFRESVPQLAFKNPFLLHSLLATSALHMHQLNPSDSGLLQLAFKHHQISLACQRQELAALNQNNCEPLFVTSSFIIIAISAFRRIHAAHFSDIGPTPLEQMIEVFVFRRGNFLISRTCGHWLKQTKLIAMIQQFSIEGYLGRAHTILEPLELLKQRNNSTYCSCEEIGMYTRTIDELHKWYYHTIFEGGDVLTAMIWPCLFEDEYMTALREQRPMALAILAFFCVMLSKITQLWWYAGTGKELLIWIAQQLPNDWQASIAWAKAEVGLSGDQYTNPAMLGVQDSNCLPPATLPLYPLSAVMNAPPLSPPHRVVTENLPITGTTNTEPAVRVFTEVITPEPLLEGTAAKCPIYTHQTVPTTINNETYISPQSIRWEQLFNHQGVNIQFNDPAPGAKVPMHRTTLTDYMIFLKGDIVLITPDEAFDISTGIGKVNEIIRDTVAAALNIGTVEELESVQLLSYLSRFMRLSHCYSYEDLLAQFDTNVFGTIKVTQALLPHFRQRRSGTMVFISSLSGWIGHPSCGAYAGSKFALEALVESLHDETSSLGLKTLLIEPGRFRTKLLTPGNMKLVNSSIPDYQDFLRKQKDSLAKEDQAQPGDPVKLVEIVLDVVRDEGIAKGKEVPFRLALGSDAYSEIRAKCEQTLLTLDQWKRRLREQTSKLIASSVVQ